jgi:hypothetical protein
MQMRRYSDRYADSTSDHHPISATATPHQIITYTKRHY